MSKRADDDTRTEALCRYCGQTILPRRIQIALLASNIPPHELRQHGISSRRVGQTE